MIESKERDPFGNSASPQQVFLRAGVLGDLYERKKQLFDGILIKFQARCRGYLARKKYERALVSSLLKLLKINIIARSWKAAV